PQVLLRRAMALPRLSTRAIQRCPRRGALFRAAWKERPLALRPAIGGSLPGRPASPPDRARRPSAPRLGSLTAIPTWLLARRDRRSNAAAESQGRGPSRPLRSEA